jgi:DNA-binding MurR/RpiR family transcriptional regulator
MPKKVDLVRKGEADMNGDLLKIIEDGMPSFSKGQRLIAAYILKHYEKAAYLTASRLGTIVGVSESTVVRFANELGFEGYPELQQALKKLIRSRLTSVQRMEVTNSLIGEGDILEKVLSSDISKIRQTMEEIDRQSFDDAVNRIVNAKNIYIIGVRSSSTLAGFLNYSLRMIFDNVRFVQTTSGSEMFEQIMQVGSGDVMFAISFPRYSTRIINAVEYAKGRGADVVALTDSKLSPIAAYADQLLIAHSDMASFMDSLVAPLSIINAIVVAVARKKQDEVSERLRVLEEVWDRYDVYDKKGQ